MKKKKKKKFVTHISKYAYMFKMPLIQLSDLSNRQQVDVVVTKEKYCFYTA
jgi:hypothetical protein